MIRSPIALRLVEPDAELFRALSRRAAGAGAKGLVLEALGDFAPARLADTARREIKLLLRGAPIELAAIAIPTRRGFDSLDQIDDRLRRIDQALRLGYELGTRLALIRVGPVPAAEQQATREAFRFSLEELARRADHHGMRVAIETEAFAPEPLGAVLDELDQPALAASIQAPALLHVGRDPVASVSHLARHVAHAYAVLTDPHQASTAAPNPRGFGFPPGALDWEAYLGALEEIDYRGYLTLWPERPLDPIDSLQALVSHLNRF